LVKKKKKKRKEVFDFHSGFFQGTADSVLRVSGLLATVELGQRHLPRGTPARAGNATSQVLLEHSSVDGQ